MAQLRTSAAPSNFVIIAAWVRTAGQPYISTQQDPLATQQDPSAANVRGVQQLRASIARDLALETVERRQRQPVPAPTHVEPHRVLAASRLDVRALKERCERSDLVHAQFKRWAMDSAGQSHVEAGPGCEEVENGKGHHRTVPAWPHPDVPNNHSYSCEHQLPGAGQVIDAVLSHTAPPETVGEQSTTITALQRSVKQSNRTLKEPAIRSIDSPVLESSGACSTSRVVRMTKATSRKMLRKGTSTAEVKGQGGQHSWAVSAEPDEPGSAPGYSFMCVLHNRRVR